VIPNVYCGHRYGVVLVQNHVETVGEGNFFEGYTCHLLVHLVILGRVYFAEYFLPSCFDGRGGG